MPHSPPRLGSSFGDSLRNQVDDEHTGIQDVPSAVFRLAIPLSDRDFEHHRVARDPHAVRERRAVVDAREVPGRDEGDGPRDEGGNHQAVGVSLADRDAGSTLMKQSPPGATLTGEQQFRGATRLFKSSRAYISWTMKNPPYILLYDRDCGICSAVSRWIRALDWRGRIRLQSIQSSRNILVGIPADRMLDALHVGAPAGPCTPGARAVRTLIAPFPIGAGVERVLRESAPLMRVVHRFYRFLTQFRDRLVCRLEPAGTSAGSGL